MLIHYCGENRLYAQLDFCLFVSKLVFNLNLRQFAAKHDFLEVFPVADPGENLTGALHSNFGRGGCGGCG